MMSFLKTHSRISTANVMLYHNTFNCIEHAYASICDLFNEFVPKMLQNMQKRLYMYSLFCIFWNIFMWIRFCCTSGVMNSSVDGN